jgi:hypothetical protein
MAGVEEAADMTGEEGMTRVEGMETGIKKEG